MSNTLWSEPKHPSEAWEIIRTLGDQVANGVATSDDENYADGRFLDMVLAIANIKGEYMTDGECLEAIMVLTDLWAEIHC